MFTLIQDTPEAGDCTAGYKVQFSKTCTVREFIEEVLKKNPGEWGEFELKHFGVRTEYKYGRLVKQKFADELLDSKIVRAYASGGWTRMDYKLTIDPKDENSYKPGKITESKGIFQNGNTHAALPFSWTREQLETFDRLCNDIRLETIELEQTIAGLAMKQSNLRQKVECLTHIVGEIFRKENNV